MGDSSEPVTMIFGRASSAETVASEPVTITLSSFCSVPGLDSRDPVTMTLSSLTSDEAALAGEAVGCGVEAASADAKVAEANVERIRRDDFIDFVGW